MGPKWLLCVRLLKREVPNGERRTFFNGENDVDGVVCGVELRGRIVDLRRRKSVLPVKLAQTHDVLLQRHRVKRKRLLRETGHKRKSILESCKQAGGAGCNLFLKPVRGERLGVYEAKGDVADRGAGVGLMEGGLGKGEPRTGQSDEDRGE